MKHRLAEPSLPAAHHLDDEDDSTFERAPAVALRADRLLASRRHGSVRLGEKTEAPRSSALLQQALDAPEQPAIPDDNHLVRWKIPTGLIAIVAVLLTLFTLWTTLSGSPGGGGAETLAVADSPGQAETTAGREASASLPPSNSEGATAGTSLVVHVAGAVARPGVYTLPAGSRINEAIEAAGGPLPEANTGAINLAGELTDGIQIYLPLVGEEAPVAAGTGAPAGAAAAQQSNGLVNLNTASAEELQTLPKVGPVLAEKIIAWRTEHGGFQSVDELDQVSGVGPATMENLRDLVTV